MKRNHVPINIFKNPIHFLAFGLGSGLSPYAPGTAGTLAAVPLVWWMQHLSPSTYVLLTALFFLLGIWLCHVTAKDMNEHDHSGIVWDEFVGYMITMFAAPLGWMWLFVGFLLFRFFDVVKPWPVSVLDKKVQGGLGIMLDDVMAGVYAWLVMWIAVYFMGAN
ncbi:MAG: phosphatidylglycerophosphatase A [Gammaproteobacteria bacterium]|nr:phosphatidylglycerophosphatase A [Gammaproteobacteria bacterium]MDH5799321.1 phosphatidylglycerophosphatase A [Gammaproteobacteria bacterium]